MTSDSPLAVGDPAPDVAAPLVSPDGDTDRVPLSALYADHAVLLCFYTNDFTPDCVAEWCAFRDYDWFTTDDRVRVVGASKSTPFTHRKFIDYLDLGFPLYADRDLALSDAFGVTYRTLGLLSRSRRSCFLVDTDGVVRYRWLADHPIDPTRDTPDVAAVHGAVEDLVGANGTETFGFS
jgi:peroxiredoxin